MDYTLNRSYIRKNIFTYLIDIVAVFCVYLLPTFSHLTGVPFYLFEPMRIFVILALLHSNKMNAYLLAFTLPVFSFAIASHPVFLKSIIISVELIINVFLYHQFINRKISGHLSILLSIIISKLVYYVLKYIMISALLIHTELFSTPIYLQVISTFIFSIYAYIIFKIRKSKIDES